MRRWKVVVGAATLTVGSAGAWAVLGLPGAADGEVNIEISASDLQELGSSPEAGTVTVREMPDGTRIPVSEEEEARRRRIIETLSQDPDGSSQYTVDEMTEILDAPVVLTTDGAYLDLVPKGTIARDGGNVEVFLAPAPEAETPFCEAYVPESETRSVRLGEKAGVTADVTVGPLLITGLAAEATRTAACVQGATDPGIALVLITGAPEGATLLEEVVADVAVVSR